MEIWNNVPYFLFFLYENDCIKNKKYDIMIIRFEEIRFIAYRGGLIWIIM